MTVYLNMSEKFEVCLILELNDSYKLFKEQGNSSLWKSLVGKLLCKRTTASSQLFIDYFHRSTKKKNNSWKIYKL